jgi:hypothetical protein
MLTLPIPPPENGTRRFMLLPGVNIVGPFDSVTGWGPAVVPSGIGPLVSVTGVPYETPFDSVTATAVGSLVPALAPQAASSSAVKI